jgi:hypothetical protein
VKPPKLFTVAEVNARVPRLTLLVERLQRGALRLEDERRALAASRGIAPDDVDTEELLRERAEARLLVEDLDAVVQEIEETGAQLKDVRLGLLDFPGEVHGEVVCLCWQFGETEVAFWHRESEGFGGRQPLPGATRPRWLQ